MNDLDKWSAETCNVSIISTGGWVAPYLSETVLSEWTLSDPRCMQVFRERFKMNTVYSDSCMAFVLIEEKYYSALGKTIAEAEMACAKAIYEAEKDNE